MQARYTIQHAVYQSGAVDADGYPLPEGYGVDVDRPAYLIQPQSSDVPVGNDELSQRIIDSLVIGVPDVSVYNPGDRVILPGKSDPYRVSEDVRDMSTGPWPDFKPSGDAASFGSIVVERVRG